MAAVYRVRDTKSDQTIALKRGWARDRTRALKRRALLEREFYTLAHLNHPRIIEVYDFGVDDDGPYYTMELLDGADLDQGGRLPWQNACAILRDVASSLAILHSRGLIHRDVTLRNVRRTADGRVKLFDFGAMMSAGVAIDVVGTPPFMAPEVLQMQSLDARVDLFSLGALGYYLLTGRHAFPARRVSDLRDIWRSRPAPPARLFPEIPVALSDLIMQLLSLDRAARPPGAADVMERLCAIADLPKEDLPAITQAYLATPTLVGREKALVSARNRILSLVRGDGGTLLIEGFSGYGRSRMIDACVFDGKLSGAVVLRASASDAVSGDWSVARALCTQLFDLLPKEAAEAVRLSKHVLFHVLGELALDVSSTHSASLSMPEHSLILRELRDLVLVIARQHRVMIAVDDADRIDHPSAAWLAALADKIERQKVLLVLATEPPGRRPQSASLHVLRSLAHVVPLDPLSPEHTEALLRSVFGDVPNVQYCAGRVHSLAHGSPLATMEFAQHLVVRGLARYEAGSWLLPTQLDERDLPATLSESLLQRLDALSPDARELAETLSLTHGHALLPENYRTLSTHRDLDRIYGALEELVAARVIVARLETYDFTQRGFVSMLHDMVAPARRSEVHRRFADLLAESGGDIVQRAYHLLHGRRELEAIRLLCSMDLFVQIPPLGILEEAVAFAEREASVSTSATQQLRTALLLKSSTYLAVETFRKYLPRVLAQLSNDSGLTLYHELRDVPADQRLAQALAQQQQRFLATPESERVFGIGDGVRELARTVAASCAMAGSMFDMELVEALPSLEPLFPLSPALPVVSQLAQACGDWIAGRGLRSKQVYEQALARLQQPDRAGMEPHHYDRVLFTVQYALGLIEASFGIERAEERAKFLESDRQMRVNSWRLRAVLLLNQGDSEAARKCSRRAELLQLQDGKETRFLGASVGFELRAFSLAEDLLGVKSAVDALSMFASVHAGWRPMYIFGQSRYRELQGDLDAALELIDAGLELAKPGRHMLYGFMAAARVRLLRELNRVPEALECAPRYLAICDAEELTTPVAALRLEYALALVQADQAEQAAAMVDGLIQGAEAMGSSGLALGVFYEARARVAIAMGDAQGFERYSAQCAHEYKKGRSSAVAAKYARLIEQAASCGLAPTLPDREDAALLAFEPESEYNTVHSRIIECVDGPDRARCALTMLLQSTDAYQGFLYGMTRNGLVPLAGFPEPNTDPDLDAWLEHWVSSEREAISQSPSDSTATQSEPPTQPEDDMTDDGTVEGGRRDVPAFYTDPDARRFQPLLLLTDGEQPCLAAVLVLQQKPGRRAKPSERLMKQIAAQLIENRDVEGVTV